MSDNSNNPYAAPNFETPVGMPASTATDELANRSTRFVASMLDGILLMVVYMPIQLLTGFNERALNQEVGVLENLSMTFLAIAIFLAFHGYLLLKRGQTVGKFVMKIQIVDQATNQLLPFLRVFVLRYLWLLPLSLIIIMIPTKSVMDGLIVPVLGQVDALFIFGAGKLCIHDHIASSKVVRFQQNRQRLD